MPFPMAVLILMPFETRRAVPHAVFSPSVLWTGVRAFRLCFFSCFSLRLRMSIRLVGRVRPAVRGADTSGTVGRVRPAVRGACAPLGTRFNLGKGTYRDRLSCHRAAFLLRVNSISYRVEPRVWQNRTD